MILVLYETAGKISRVLSVDVKIVSENILKSGKSDFDCEIEG